MGNGFHFDWSAGLIFLAGIACSIAVHYVKTTAQGAASSGVQKASDALTLQLEKLAAQLMTKIDGLSTAIGALNITMGRSEERTEANHRAIERLQGSAENHTDAISRLDTRLARMESK